VVHASSVNDFKNKLDAYWSTQEMMYNYRTEISGTETEVLQCKLQVLCTFVC